MLKFIDHIALGLRVSQALGCFQNENKYSKNIFLHPSWKLFGPTFSTGKLKESFFS